MRFICFLLLPFLMAFDTPLANANQEKRARALMEEIRCVACENEPISQSNSKIAENMRARVREMISNGDSDADVRSWFAERYGEFVLFRPSTQGTSGRVLWSVPFGLLIVGALTLSLARGRGQAASEIESIPAESFDADPEDEPDHAGVHETDTQS